MQTATSAAGAAAAQPGAAPSSGTLQPGVAPANGTAPLAGASGSMDPTSAVNCAASSARHVDNRDGTVTRCFRDGLFGLVWQQDTSQEDLPWDSAGTYCAQLGTAGRIWRLPTLDELDSISHLQNASPHIEHEFLDTSDKTFWSGTVVPTAPNEAWTYTYTNLGHSGSPFVTRHWVRCASDAI